jgi:hypothetical protein
LAALLDRETERGVTATHAINDSGADSVFLDVGASDQAGWFVLSYK